MNLLNKISIPPQYKASNWLLIALVGCLYFFTLSACKVKEGCPTKDYTNAMEKNTKRGKSNLFDKSMRKKVKK